MNVYAISFKKWKESLKSWKCKIKKLTLEI